MNKRIAKKILKQKDILNYKEKQVKEAQAKLPVVDTAAEKAKPKPKQEAASKENKKAEKKPEEKKETADTKEDKKTSQEEKKAEK